MHWVPLMSLNKARTTIEARLYELNIFCGSSSASCNRMRIKVLI